MVLMAINSQECLMLMAQMLSSLIKTQVNARHAVRPLKRMLIIWLVSESDRVRSIVSVAHTRSKSFHLVKQLVLQIGLQYSGHTPLRGNLEW